MRYYTPTPFQKKKLDGPQQISKNKNNEQKTLQKSLSSIFAGLKVFESIRNRNFIHLYPKLFYLF